MKTLYLSDLDGTLLNTKKRITPKTAELLNACVEKGLQFSVATARMPYGCDYRLSELKINTPGILTNGVFLYDFTQKRYIDVEAMEQKAALAALDCFAGHDTGCFLYLFSQDAISLYYNRPELTEQTQYYSERALQSCPTVECHPNLSELVKDGGNAVYLAATGAQEALAPIDEAIRKIPGLETAFYLNIYNGLYCLEVFSSKATKKNALQKLKARYGFDEVVVFGDNLNDLSMIEIADRSYAPANALEVVKEQVTAVLEDCDHDGVARFLAQEFGVESK